MADSTLKTYYGNCHCGAFKFHFRHPEIVRGNNCNCSICHKKGQLWVYPEAENFAIDQGKDSLVDYRFGKMKNAHKFCPTCGTPVLEVDDEGPMGIRTLRDFDVWSLWPYPHPKAADGASYEPRYIPPEFPGPDPRTEEEKKELKLYTGSCHCGAVRVAVKTKPIPEIRVNEDDCSICIRNANILIYPKRDAVTIDGAENLTRYTFGPKENEHKFCRICGVTICVTTVDPPDSVKGAWSAEQQEAWPRVMLQMPLSIRMLEGVEWDRLTITRHIMSNNPPLYVVE